MGCSDIHLEPHSPEMRVRYRVDGEMQQVMTIPNHIEEAVIGRIKVMGDMDTTETRKPQDGNLTIDENGTRASFRVSTIPVVGGEKVDRNPPLIMASEDFSFMLEQVPGCYINIGNGDGEGACEVHNPAYDFNDEAIPLGAAFFVRAVERKLAKA